MICLNPHCRTYFCGGCEDGPPRAGSLNEHNTEKADCQDLRPSYLGIQTCSRGRDCWQCWTCAWFLWTAMVAAVAAFLVMLTGAVLQTIG